MESISSNRQIYSSDEPDGVFLICLLFFGLTVWTFFPVLRANFQYFDESAELHNNAHVNSGIGWQNLRWALFSLEYSNWCPLNWVSHMLDYEMFGEDPWGHHLTNVLLHAANGVLLFLVLKRITGALWRSLVVALLFALHPLSVESVAWISERKNVLSAFWGLLALWMYARFAEESKTQGGRPKPFYGLTFLFFVFSLMSKAMLVTFPFVLLLLDYWPLQRWALKDRWTLGVEKIPFFLVIIPASVAAYFAEKSGESLILHEPLSMRLETAVMGYARYLGKIFWPADISALYPYPDSWPATQLVFAVLLIAGISVVAIVLRHRRSYYLIGWLFYLGTLVPVIGIVQEGVQSMANRHSYIPMIGVLLLVVWAIGDLSKQRRGRVVLMATGVVLILGVCISRTRAEIVYWKDGPTIWSRAIAVTEKNFMAHFCLANTLPSAKFNEGLAEYQKSVDIYPDYFDAQLGLANLLSAGGRFSEHPHPL